MTVKSPKFPAPHSSQVILQLTYVTNTNSIFWCKCSRIPFKPSFINGLCNFLTAMRCQKKNHITRFGGCVRCIKLESKPSYRADRLIFVFALSSFDQLIALLSLLLNEPCARTLPSWCKAIFHRLFLLMCPDGSSLFLFFPDVSNACVACLQSSRRLLKNGCKQHTCDFFLDWR